VRISLEKIKESSFQIRDTQEDEALYELAESIRAHGLLQPIKVRPLGEEYEIVYGHRRVAAMRLLGLDECEAFVEGIDDEESQLQALIENLQRKDMNEVEKGKTFLALTQRFGYTKKQLAQMLGKTESYVRQAIDVVTVLPESIQNRVQAVGNVGTPSSPTGISSFHAQEMLRLRGEDSFLLEEVAAKIEREGLSGRQTRELTKALKSAPSEEVRRQILRTPWTRNEEEILRDIQGLAIEMVKPQRTSQPQERTEVRVHNKLIWNLQRIDLTQFGYYTIGYSGRTLEQFLEVLKLAGVETVADVRADPISQYRPEFSKQNLQTALTANGINYVHYPELGVPREIRLKLRQSSDQDWFSEWYDVNILSHADGQLDQFEKISHPIAIMCVEIDPTKCHRHRIALALEKRGFKTFDL
jgi:ParB family chromosome partitioning protein